ncbi:MAG: hypothetical protein ABSB40_14385, partial [Nitrososphaeria archaeon]
MFKKLGVICVSVSCLIISIGLSGCIGSSDITTSSTTSQTTASAPTLGSPQGVYLFAITTGSDGNLWFTDTLKSKIGKISPKTGVITEYNLPTINAYPNGITAGPDGNLWFT